MKEREKWKRGKEESLEREDRPSNTSDEREVRELEPRIMEARRNKRRD